MIDFYVNLWYNIFINILGGVIMTRYSFSQNVEERSRYIHLPSLKGLTNSSELAEAEKLLDNLGRIVSAWDYGHLEIELILSPLECIEVTGTYTHPFVIIELFDLLGATVTQIKQKNGNTLVYFKDNDVSNSEQ